MSETSKAERLEEQVTGLRRRVVELEANALADDALAEGLRHSEARFRKIFDHSNDAIFLVDPFQDVILDVNSRACQMLGYSREELLAVPVSFIHPHEMKQMRGFAESVREAGDGWTDELTCLTKGGTFLSAEISASMTEIDGRPCMIAHVRDVSERNRLTLENRYLLDQLDSELQYGEIIGRGPAMDQLLEQIELVATTDATVLITGESGTGKELVARAIHERSARRDHSLVRVNCASIPRELFESEFFGHVKGAFTGAIKRRTGRFELAHGGTLLLDEVGEIPLELQSKLLRVLQEGQFERVGESFTRNVDVRVLAASNRDLKAEAEARRFRADLFYRLGVFPILVPPLRDRVETIPMLAEHFVRQSAQRLKLTAPTLTKAHIRTLQRYHWPGNVRELQNVIERAVILSRRGGLHFDLGDSSDDAAQPRAIVAAEASTEAVLTLGDLKRLEASVIRCELEHVGWKIYGPDGAAARLGLKPTTLASRMKRLGIERPD